MASAIFTLKDTPEVRTELSLLLQIEPAELTKVSHGGLLTIEFPELLENKAMHVIVGAVASHGFSVSINHSPTKRIMTELQPKAAKKDSK